MFIRYPSSKSEIPLRQLVPNMLTSLALCCGMASLHFSIREDWDRALFAVLLAMVFDGLDGRMARLLRVTSRFGAVLDSLSDFLSFGVAPAVLLYQWMLKREDAAGLAAVMTYVLCAALRLARFTAAANVPRTDAPVTKPSPLAVKFFVGMPSPAAAAAVLLPVMLHESKHLTKWNDGPFVTAWWLVILYTFLIAGLMISRMPMYSFKKIRILRPLVVPLMALLGMVVVSAIKDVWLTGAVIAGLYLLTLPVSIVSHRRMVAGGGVARVPSGAATGVSEDGGGSRA